jgi:hypothetical protein
MGSDLLSEPSGGQAPDKEEEILWNHTSKFTNQQKKFPSYPVALKIIVRNADNQVGDEKV